jgi:ABC-2 type transport system permease protein
MAIAWRELVATVMTKGFVIGVVFMPLFAGLALAVVPALIEAPPTRGALAILDRTGVAAPHVARRFAEPITLDQEGLGPPFAAHVAVEVLDPKADVDEVTAALRRPQHEDGAWLAVAVLSEETLASGAPFELFVAERLDVMLQLAIGARIGEAIVDARLAASGLDVARVRELAARPRAIARTVTASGAEETNEMARVLLPGAFMLLLWIASFTAGQFLLTTLVEEKSVRVMEVLLSAATPLELLAGKVAGQAGVAGIILLVYAALGGGTLSALGLLHVVSPGLLVLLVAFFLCAFLVIASIMAAVGSVVDDLRSAQSLLGPILFILTLPTLLWLPITRAPGSSFAVTASFLPLVGPFVTVLRLGTRDPVPPLQLAGALAAAAATAALAIVAAGKIFQVGVLFYGKPPTLRTLLRWLRARPS